MIISQLSNLRASLTLDRVMWHTSCSIHRPLPTYQILIKSEKLPVDGPALLGRHNRSRPKNTAHKTMYDQPIL